MITATASAQRSTARGPATLAVLSVAQFLIALDYSIIYIALPSIGADLHVDAAVAQWVVSAYAVLFAGFLVVGGRLADLVGHRRLFVVAIVTFGMASAIGSVAIDATMLLIARGAQGIGAALLQPAVLGLIGTTFPAGPARGKALAVWGSVGASGLAAGAILGGVLTTASWRLTFVINVPLTLLCAAGALAWVAADRVPAGTRRGRAPVLASVLGTGTVLTLVLGLTLSSARGWTSALTVGCLAAAVVLFLAFIRNEKASANVLIEPILRRTRTLRVGAMATALYMASVGSEFYLLTLLLQAMKHYTPLQAGLAFLPLAVMVTAGSTTAAACGAKARPGHRARRRIRPRDGRPGLVIPCAEREFLRRRPAARADPQRVRPRRHLHVDVHHRHPRRARRPPGHGGRTAHHVAVPVRCPHHCRVDARDRTVPGQYELPQRLSHHDVCGGLGPRARRGPAARAQRQRLSTRVRNAVTRDSHSCGSADSAWVWSAPGAVQTCTRSGAAPR